MLCSRGKGVAEAYDGAATMSGAVGAVRVRFKVNHLQAIYVHCDALNLVLCHTCQAVTKARDLFFSVSFVKHH